MYNSIKTIRYMGNKNKLLDFIVPEIIKNTKDNDVICELMCGTCCIGYALKNNRIIYENDIQYYSYIIAKGLINNNNETISKLDAEKDLYIDYKSNQENRYWNFFETNYSDTYFSESQCEEIDSIRYAIEKIKNKSKKALYLIALMGAMSTCESTSGHFAQYLPSEHPRLKEIRIKCIWDEFATKCDDYKYIINNKHENKIFNCDYKELINYKEFNKVDLVYIDPPYTSEQYSRFYHILETVCKYDNPRLEHKGLYRNDRFLSSLSLRKKAFNEFESLIKILSEKNKTTILSYSTKGLLKDYEMEYLFKKYYKTYYIKKINYSHSTQGKGNIILEELLFVGKN